MYKLLIFMLMFGTNSKHKETIKSVELSYQTRGTQEYLQITADSIFIKINGKIAIYKTSSVQWRKILKSFGKVKLSGIAKLKRPTTKSFYDGAFVSQLTVVTNLKEYESISFDHDMPLSALIKAIDAMKQTLIGTDNKENF